MLPGPPAIVFTDHNTPMPEQRRWISGVNCYEVELAFGQFMFKHGTYAAALTPSRRFHDWALSRGAPPEKLHGSRLRNRVTLLVDTFTPDEMPDVYRASDCVLFLSDAEGFGLVGIEALACGVPLIARESKGIDEYLVHGKTGWAVQGDSGLEIAAAVRHVCEDGDLRAAMARTGRGVAVSEFSLAAMIGKIERLYAVVVEQKRIFGPGVLADLAMEPAGAASGSRAGGWR